MDKSLIRGFFLFFIFFKLSTVPAQSPAEYIVVRNILLKGNQKTKDYIVLRELDFKQGDTLDLKSLQARFERNVNWFANTDLFADMQFNIENWDMATGLADIAINVKEAWYIYPVPLVELADRNFNIWWRDHNHSLRRINLGLTYNHFNFTGRLDKLVLTAMTGFTQKAEAEYRLPYFNKAHTLGFAAKLSFIRNRTVGYRINEQLKEQFFFNEERFSLRRFRLNWDWHYRPKLRLTHSLLTAYHDNRIAPVVADSLNEQFFGHGRLRERYPHIGYRLRYDGRDVSLYAMEGRMIEFNVEYDGAIQGAGPDRLQANLYGALYRRLSKRWSVEVAGKVNRVFRYRRPGYYHTNSLGGDTDYVRGYEYYVLNGQDFFYLKNSFRYRLIKKKYRVKGLSNWVGDIPFRLFLTLNNDLGAIREEYFPAQNSFSGRLLHGHGVGMDFVFFYGRAIQVEYTLNGLGEKGLFLHLKLFN